MLEYIGYFCAVVIGMVLGLTGTGGAILTVPVLVYLMGFNPVTAAAYSLFIVGTTSTFGTFQNFRKGTVEIRTGFIYAFPSLIGVFLSRRFIVPALPDVLFTISDFTVTKEIFVMVLFAIIMFMSGISMLKPKKKDDDTEDETKESSGSNRIWMFAKVFFAGIVVGLVGAGGGFLFIPLLIYVAKLPMKKAVATSLLIIAINSLIGFTGDLFTATINWIFLFTFTIFSVMGIFTGIFLSRYFNDAKLKKGFGIFVLTMAAFIMIRELIV